RRDVRTSAPGNRVPAAPVTPAGRKLVEIDSAVITDRAQNQPSVHRRAGASGVGQQSARDFFPGWIFPHRRLSLRGRVIFMQNAHVGVNRKCVHPAVMARAGQRVWRCYTGGITPPPAPLAVAERVFGWDTGDESLVALLSAVDINFAVAQSFGEQN